MWRIQLQTFEPCLGYSQFLSEWKKGNVSPVFKEVDKQLLKHYRQISLLPVTGKVFKRLLHNKMFEWFIRNDLISQKQSGFKPDHSSITWKLKITKID